MKLSCLGGLRRCLLLFVVVCCSLLFLVGVCGSLLLFVGTGTMARTRAPIIRRMGYIPVDGAPVANNSRLGECASQFNDASICFSLRSLRVVRNWW